MRVVSGARLCRSAVAGEVGSEKQYRVPPGRLPGTTRSADLIRSAGFVHPSIQRAANPAFSNGTRALNDLASWDSLPLAYLPMWAGNLLI